MKGNFSAKIEALTLELAGIRSIVGTREENNVVERIYDRFGQMNYFKAHPEKVKYVPVQNDPWEEKASWPG